MILEIIVPNKEIIVMGVRRLRFIKGNTKDIRIIPYLPSLRRMAARIIDPATGASTWALGNHR